MTSASGIEVSTNGEWLMTLPLGDGSFQVVKALSVKQVMSKMPHLHFKHSLDIIKAEYPGNKELQELKVPEELIGDIDMNLGIAYNRIYPEAICTLPSGLQVLKSRLLPANKGEVCFIGGPTGALSLMINRISAQSTIQYMYNMINDLNF